MKSTTPASLPIKNDDKFTAPFFKRFHLRKCDKPLKLESGHYKTYSFPTLYHDAHCAIAIFLCNYQAACAIMPHRSCVPVKFTLGRAAAIFSSYRYRHVHGLASYNEVAMSIPVIKKKFINTLLPLHASQWFSGIGYYVFSMPVTSHENQARGQYFWGLPKVTQRIDIITEGTEHVTEAYDGDGQKYFALRLPKGGRQIKMDKKNIIYTFQDNRVKTSINSLMGRFNVSTYGKTLCRKNLQPKNQVLWIGDSPSAAILHGLEIEPHPLQLRYAESINASFDLPLDL